MRNEIDDATLAKSSADRVEPTRMSARSEIEEAKHENRSTERPIAQCTEEGDILKVDPNAAACRSDSADPHCVKSSSDKSVPYRANPRIESEEPKAKVS